MVKTPSMIILEAKSVSAHRRQITKKNVETFKTKFGRSPGLAVVLVGHDPASQVYVRNKEKACQEAGIHSFRHDLPTDTNFDTLKKLLSRLHSDKNVDGILVQLPLPKQISADEVLEILNPLKDVDGLTYENLGLLWAGRPRVKPCTPFGVMAMLEHYKISVAGKRAVVIGRSNIVGKPMAQLLMDAQATVTICHSKTPDLKVHTLQADIVVVAAGQPRFIGKDHFKKDSVVVDVGMHKKEDGKLCGDVRFEELENWVEAATPVPGGVGLMTVTMLLENTLRLAELAEEKGSR